MILTTMTKTPTDHLDYDVSFARWLDGDDVISAATAAVEDGTVTISSIDFDDQIVKVWAQGGMAGETNTIIVTATTVDERVKQIGSKLKIREI